MEAADDLSDQEIDAVFALVQKQYRKYGKRGKPNEKEWTHLAAILAKIDGELNLLSLATGTKCLSGSAVSDQGFSVNDSHAEVLARRSFVSLLYSQMIALLSKAELSKTFLLFDPETRKFRVHSDTHFYMYCSHTPCGDASIVPHHEPSVSSDGTEEECQKKRAELNIDDIHRTGAKCIPSDVQDPLMPGSEYHSLGAFRTKPGRGERTLSMSCSDKFAKWAQLGIQGSLPMKLLEKPIYLSAVIFGKCPFSQAAIDRAITQRNYGFQNSNKTFALRIPRVIQKDFCSPTKNKAYDETLTPSHLASVWNCCMEKPEVLVDGYRQGITAEKRNLVQARSVLSRWTLAQNFAKISKSLLPENTSDLENNSYLDMKRSSKDYYERWTELKEHYKHWIDDSRKFHAQSFIISENKKTT